MASISKYIVAVGVMMIFPGSTFGGQSRTFSVSLSGETMKLMHPPRSLEVGYGGAIQFQYDFSKNVSLLGSVSYARSGTNKDVIILGIYKDAFERFYDTFIGLGG